MQIRNLFRSKAGLGAIFLAIALWIYTAFTQDYVESIKVPLLIQLPPNRAIEDPLTEEVTVQVKATGWQLLQLKYIKSSAQANVDLRYEKIEKDTFFLSNNEVRNSIKDMQNIEIRDVSPDNLKIITGSVVSKLVKVQPDIRITTKNGFIIIGDLKIKPDTIELTGNAEIISSIDRWFTKKAIFNDVNKSFKATIQLSDSMSNIVNMDIKQIEMEVEVQQEGDLVIPDVEVSIEGGLMPTTSEIYPETVDVIFSGGVDELADFPIEKVSVYVDYKSLIADSTGIIPLKIIAPKGYKGIKLLKINPPYIYHNKKDRILRTRIF